MKRDRRVDFFLQHLCTASSTKIHTLDRWFKFNCTSPPEGTFIVGGLPYRSTADIVWPCLATLIACTYTVLHLDVIASDCVTKEQPKLCFWTNLWRVIKAKSWSHGVELAVAVWAHLWRVIKAKSRSHGVELAVAVWAVFVPEIMCYTALREWVAARRLKKSLADEQKAKSSSQSTQDLRTIRWTKTHAHYIMMGGMRLCCRSRLSHLCHCEELMLDSESYLGLLKDDHISCHPPLSESEVFDHSKSGLFTKLLAALQVLWFAATLFLRLGRHLPVSQLEVGIAGYVLLTLFTYYWYLKKPKSVECGTRVYLLATDDSTPCAQLQPEKLGTVPGMWQQRQRQGERSEHFFYEFMHQIGYQFKDFHHTEGNILTFTFLTFLFVAFGAVHVAAWNLAFPGLVDRWLWRVAALTTTGLPLILLPIPQVARIAGRPHRDSKRAETLRFMAALLLYFIGCILYILARLVLLVEMCRDIFYLPPNAFVNTWTSNLPHYG